MHLLPNRNLVSNHGFGPAASHTRDANSKFAYLLTEAMHFPLVHPSVLLPDADADGFTERIMFSGLLKQLFARARAFRRRQFARHPEEQQ